MEPRAALVRAGSPCSLRTVPGGTGTSGAVVSGSSFSPFSQKYLGAEGRRVESASSQDRGLISGTEMSPLSHHSKPGHSGLNISVNSYDLFMLLK